MIGREICPRCGVDDDVTFEPGEADAPVFVCSSSRHEDPFEWPARDDDLATALAGRVGFAEELNLYEYLMTLFDPSQPLVEYGVVEHRFAAAFPTEYRAVIDRYGHTHFGPKRYTASAFLAKVLWALHHEGALAVEWVPATGRWSYNSRVSGWALPRAGGVPAKDVLSWEAFARQHDIDPDTWPALEN